MMNKRLRILLAADALISGSYGMMMPILPLFMTSNVSGANLKTIAIAISIYLFSQAAFGWIFSAYMHHKNTADRAIGGVFFGSICIALVPAAYMNSWDMAQIMLTQALLGLGFGMMYQGWSWLAKENAQEDFHGSIKKFHNLTSSIGTAILAVIGGYIAYEYGFQALLYAMTLVAASGTVLASTLFFAKKK